MHRVMHEQNCRKDMRIQCAMYKQMIYLRLIIHMLNVTGISQNGYLYLKYSYKFIEDYA